MITFFSVPKPWKDHINTIQRNALRSWKLLDVRIILFGDEPGTKEAAKEFDVEHVPHITKNKFGTPLISSVFKRAQNRTRSRAMAFVNTDIILFQSFKETALLASNHFDDKFLMIGRRWNMGIHEELEFQDGWEEPLIEKMKSSRPWKVDALDYFVFRHGMYSDMPDFAIGRSKWDNWLAGQPQANDIPTLNATKAVYIVHQKHGYEGMTFEYVPGKGKKGQEIRTNYSLYAEYFKRKIVKTVGCEQCSHVIRDGEIVNK
jgi:hypothetical protein